MSLRPFVFAAVLVLSAACGFQPSQRTASTHASQFSPHSLLPTAGDFIAGCDKAEEVWARGLFVREFNFQEELQAWETAGARAFVGHHIAWGSIGVPILLPHPIPSKVERESEERGWLLVVTAERQECSLGQPKTLPTLYILPAIHKSLRQKVREGGLEERRRRGEYGDE